MRNFTTDCRGSCCQSLQTGGVLVLLTLSLATMSSAQTCDDHLRCTLNDMCQDGRCVGTAVECPEDGNACTRERCSLSTGTCVSEPLVCPGPCFRAECDPHIGCVPLPDGTECDDGKECTTEDRCLLGICRGTPVADGTPCTDAFGPCTVNDRCQRGSCTGELVQCPDSDGDLCTPEFCDFLTGTCIALPRQECDRPCETGACNPQTGACPVLEDGTPCDDSNECTWLDRCQDGECSGIAQSVDRTPTPSCTETSRPAYSPSPSRAPLPTGTHTVSAATATPQIPVATLTMPPLTPSPSRTAAPIMSTSPPNTVTPAWQPQSHACAVGSPRRGSNGKAILFAVIPALLGLARRHLRPCSTTPGTGGHRSA